MGQSGRFPRGRFPSARCSGRPRRRCPCEMEMLVTCAIQCKATRCDAIATATCFGGKLMLGPVCCAQTGCGMHVSLRPKLDEAFGFEWSAATWRHRVQCMETYRNGLSTRVLFGVVSPIFTVGRPLPVSCERQGSGPELSMVESWRLPPLSPFLAIVLCSFYPSLLSSGAIAKPGGKQVASSERRTARMHHHGGAEGYRYRYRCSNKAMLRRRKRAWRGVDCSRLVLSRRRDGEHDCRVHTDVRGVEQAVAVVVSDRRCGAAWCCWTVMRRMARVTGTATWNAMSGTSAQCNACAHLCSLARIPFKAGRGPARPSPCNFQTSHHRLYLIFAPCHF